jgi:hypothetical protein
MPNRRRKSLQGVPNIADEVDNNFDIQRMFGE